MTHQKTTLGVSSVVTQKPLQSAKFGGILLILVLGFAGFFRLIDAGAILDAPMLGDSQFLAIILIPVASLLLICVVFLETLVTGYRIFQSNASFKNHFNRRRGYVLLRGAEAGIATVGVTIVVAALPTLFAESTPSPIGVGIMLLLFIVGIGILIMSFVRSSAELFVYRDVTKIK